MSRTERVKGRIIREIDSTKTIKGINMPGEPKGTRCAKKDQGREYKPLKREANHRRHASDRLRDIWVETVKV